MLNKINTLLSTISHEKNNKTVTAEIQNLEDRLFDIKLQDHTNITVFKKIYFTINNQIDTRIKIPIDFDYTKVLYNDSIDDDKRTIIMDKLDAYEKNWKDKIHERISNFSDSINAIIYKFINELKESYDSGIKDSIKEYQPNTDTLTSNTVIQSSDISSKNTFNMDLQVYGNKLNINTSSRTTEVNVLDFDTFYVNLYEKFIKDGMSSKEAFDKIKEIRKYELYDIGNKSEELSSSISALIDTYINEEVALYNASIKEIGDKYNVEY